MDIVKYSLQKPVTVLVGVILVVMFGLIGLFQMPYQLSPSVTEPEITVTTIWRGATPYEIEREIIEEQEKVLKGIPGLKEMESTARNDTGEVTLRFTLDTLIDDALLRVSNKLNEVPSYPLNVEKPVINATGAAASPVIWMVFKTRPGNNNSIYNYRTYFEDEVRQYLERVDGVADLLIVGGREKEMHVVVEPEKLAAHGLTVDNLIQVVSSENTNVSAGVLGVGRRNFRIRTIGEYNSPEEIEKVVIKSTGQERLTIGDVAHVEFSYAKLTDAMIHNKEEGIAIGTKPDQGANILALTDQVEKVVNWLNDNKLKEQGVYLDWVYDQRPYINGAIDLVKKNILIGGVLAVIVLLVFLQNISSTLVVAASIPISVIGTFIIMNLLGRNLNVVSLAGISFAVGMLVDNAIVVLENIDRHKKMGKSPFNAAYDGTTEVWGAVLASTLTTVAVFLPVVFIKEEAGQLFEDIAIAVTTSVTLSLFVSVSVIPMMSRQLFQLLQKKQKISMTKLTNLGTRLADGIMSLVSLAVANKTSRLLTVILWTSLAVGGSYLLFPKMEYLPQGNRNLVLSILVPPPGLSYEERHDIGEHLFEMADPYLGKDYNGYPGIKNMFYLGAERIMLFGAVGMHEQRASELIPLFRSWVQAVPGFFGISQQAGIFQTNIGKGRTIDVDLSGNDIDRVVQAAGVMFGMIMQDVTRGLPPRPIPSIELQYPEVRLIPDRDRLRAAGLDAREFGVLADVLMDGRKVGEFKQEGKKKIDLVVKASDQEVASPEELYESVIETPVGRMVPIFSLADIVETTGISEIRHFERQRTITLQVTPPEDIPLQAAMEMIQNNVIPKVSGMGMLEGITVNMSGTADKLIETKDALQWNFVLAAAIIYLLMAALFANFIYPLIILFTVPLAGAGGFIGLRLVNLFTSQPLDILTMLGFVILIGVVVNNAILIVHQALNNVRDQNMDFKDAVLESTRTRLRPIYMSASTSVFGMLPLVVAPGPGSELYRGLGSVVLGGLTLSTVLTIFVIPSLLMFAINMEKRRNEIE